MNEIQYELVTGSKGPDVQHKFMIVFYPFQRRARMSISHNKGHEWLINEIRDKTLDEPQQPIEVAGFYNQGKLDINAVNKRPVTAPEKDAIASLARRFFERHNIPIHTVAVNSELNGKSKRQVSSQKADKYIIEKLA